MPSDDLLLDAKIWADRRRKVLDVKTLRVLLELRETYADTAPTLWPAGSVTDLLTSLWPAKGDGQELDEEALRSSLDSFLRFLRNTGTMSGRSAPLADLLKEVRSSVRGINERSADRSQWSIGKQMLDYADQIGLGISEGDDIESIRSSLEVTQARWNALPVHERRALSPDPTSMHLSGYVGAQEAYGTTDAVQLVVLSMRHDLPTGSLPDPSQVAPAVRSTGLTAELRRLHAALEDREPLTSTGALKPARARALVHELALPDDGGWRSARDARALNRLWEAAAWARLLDPHATVARRLPFPDLADDETCVRFGASSFIGAYMSTLRYLSDGAGITYALVRSYVLRCGLVTWEELGGFLDDWLLPARMRAQGMSVADIEVARARLDLEAVADTGAVVVGDRGVQLTPLGDVAVTALIHQLERG